MRFCFRFSVSVSDASDQGQTKASPSGHNSNEGVSKTTEPATTEKTPSTEATTTKIPSTEATTQSPTSPDLECGVVVVGGGKIAYYCLRVKMKTMR